MEARRSSESRNYICLWPSGLILSSGDPRRAVQSLIMIRKIVPAAGD